LLGMLATPMVRIDPAWLSTGALVVTIAGGALDRERFRAAIDWGFLVFLGVLLGAGGVLRSVGLDAWLGASLVPLARLVGDPALLVIAIGALVVVVRVVLPWVPATVLLSLTLVPAAAGFGMSPWVVGLIVLTMCTTWLHPNGSDFYRVTRSAIGEQLFTDRQGAALGAAMTLVALVGLTVSIPFWRALGLLPS